MVTKKQLGLTSFFFLVFLSLLVYFKYDWFYSKIIEATLVSSAVYFATDYKNWIIVFGSVIVGEKFQVASWRSLIAGFLIAVAGDIVSFPRLPTDITQIGALKASWDWIMVSHIMDVLGVSYNYAHFIFYIIVPSILALTIVYISGIEGFWKKSGGN